MNYQRVIASKERARQLAEFNLKIYEPKNDFFIVEEEAAEQFRAAFPFITLITEPIQSDDATPDEEPEREAAQDETEETRADGSSAIVADMSTRELLDIFGLNGDQIQILQKRYSDFPITGSNGVYTARFADLKRWYHANPGVLCWSDLHFKYDGRAV